MNDKLKTIAERAFQNDSHDIPIQIGEAVLMRSEGSNWVPCVYMGYIDDEIDHYIFASGENWHSMMALMLGNEDKIGTDGDVFGLIDIEWMQQKGLIEKA